MMDDNAPDAAPAADPAAEAIAFLDRLNWELRSEVEQEAVRHCIGRLSFAALLNLIEAARQRPGFPLSFIYQAWLDRGDRNDPYRYAAWFNFGVDLAGRGAFTESAAAYKQSLAIKPDFAPAAINLGLCREHAGDYQGALGTWAAHIQPDDMRTALLNHRGRLLERCSEFEAAEKELYRSLLVDPHQYDAYSHWLYLRLRMCAWPVFGPALPNITQEEAQSGASGLSLMALFDGNDRVNRWVGTWLERRVPAAPERLSPSTGYDHDRVRIGYLSSDYALHPVSMLIAEMIETHDRNRFEVVGYCNSPEDGSGLRARVLGAFDHWHRVAGLSDEAAARLIRSHEIDILIDLNGLTEGTRLGILRWKPAPVQVTYLGFVGSMPVPELDYAIADRHVVPPELAHDFHPKPLYMPVCYQVNDTKAEIGPPESRADLGLPEDRFVFCSFSNTYKITEEVFEGWLRILAGVENSVLWVLARNRWARASMTERAVARGIDPARLIFASPASPPQYLSRLRLADLFLDTYPYNSGTTASDALRMGLPLVTLEGRSFSSRMAASLLRTIGLPEGITRSLDDYVALAVRLGSDPGLHASFRDRIAGDAWRRTIGNIEEFLPAYEDGLLSVRLRPGTEA